MLYLIKKELTSNVRYLLTGFVIFIAYMFIFAYTDVSLFSMCLIISVYTISTTNLILDERYKIELLLTALPIRRKDIVLSKYLMVPVLFVISIVLYTLVTIIGRAAGFDRIVPLKLVSVAVGFLVISIFNGITLPLAFKFGAQATRYVPFILFFAIFFLGSFLGKIDVSGAAATMLKLGDTSFSLLVLAVGLLVNAVSYSAAAPIYAKKDL